jgi:hypothetical protein
MVSTFRVPIVRRKSEEKKSAALKERTYSRHKVEDIICKAIEVFNFTELIGSAYDHWRVASIVDNAILKYRVEEEKRKAERLKKFLNESEEDGCESEWLHEK